MREYTNTISFIENFINKIVPADQIRYLPDYRFILDIQGDSLKLEFDRDIMDDFEVATQKYADTDYFYTLENEIKFDIYIFLGQRGLIPHVDISTALLNERGKWLTSNQVDIAFEKHLCELLYQGLMKLSDFLSQVLRESKVEIKEIESDKEYIDSLIDYYNEKRNLSSHGVNIESLSFLKAALVCEILEREKMKQESIISRVVKAIDEDIYKIVSLIRKEPFVGIKLPECIYEYSTYKKSKTPVKDLSEGREIPALKEKDKLNDLLERIDPNLKKKRIGAWTTFKSSNPDRFSQSANSMVELLDKVIGIVCKETELKDYLREKYQSHEETKWVDATRKWISETKDKLHRVKHHTDYKSEVLARTLLSEAESIMLVILE